MSDTLLSVEVEGLQEAIDNANEINWSDLTEALGEGLTRFKDKLRGTGKRPGDPWIGIMSARRSWSRLKA